MVTSSRSLRAVTLLIGLLFLPVIVAISPCPDKHYTLVPPEKHGKPCDCVKKGGRSHKTVKIPAHKSCKYTTKGHKCYATCPSGHSKRQIPQVFLNPDLSIINCPDGLVSCPITKFPGSNHECVNVNTDLENCGGCASLGQGEICGRRLGVRSASCIHGVCKTQSCKKGFLLDADIGECIWMWTK